MTIFVEYILDPQDKPRSFVPKTVPSYIADGGYWMNPDGSEKMIGVGVEGSIPDSVGTLTLEELQARQRAIHAKYPMRILEFHYNDTVTNMTDDEVNAVIKEWVNKRN
tara:strand:+ start:875 stop:1198 length:324 start_codon:yes stop_codon:yes gene_type:complete